MIKSIKVANIAYLSFQMHFDAKVNKKTTTKLNNENLYNMMLVTSENDLKATGILLSFVLLSYMNTEYFPDICKSVHCPNNNSKINIEFYYYDSEKSNYELVNYHLIFNENGIVKEILNDINIRTKNSGKFVPEIPEKLSDYFNNIFTFDCLNQIQVDKYFDISINMIKDFETYKLFLIDFFKYLGYNVNEIFFNDENELSVRFAYTSTSITIDEDKELKIIVSLCSIVFTVFIKTGMLYLSNLQSVLEHESLVRMFELISMNDSFTLHNNCQFIVEESSEIYTFLENSQFLFSPIIEDVQILKVTEFLKSTFVEWKKN
jgi:hypothetical protein